ncbi:hypothetical protein M2459_000435 [Parabacteroides sp. PF5-5]|uniref:hypothetical protein n=1 Tax=unclassified Parabacteroides TaxID=2649774 RepID=UPI00247556D6|nr:MULTISPECIES: hypothetical protein [unclassified Parabacteroides]MDH6303631.1 hypothetical protein [Parabacteroides sp. PH5-39]MDH6314953.1 hypothetical protein [Parabacteroides sp. PF5-13]MDH6318290.1 hypothetical protein [Parabacteroides sp. PH5-13]MDH6321777.1 hypothetical protein [Parabacteroides sp. PH5-8]MDH6325901.1 hypothetical protein [Parabacteroides sp. PH5-41]
MNIRKFIYCSIAFIHLLIISCTNETLLPSGNLPEGSVRIELFTGFEEYMPAFTRAGQADEEEIDDRPWIFVFEGTADNALFTEVQQAYVSDGKSLVVLQKNNNPCQLLIVANAPDQFSNEQGQVKTFNKQELETTLGGKTFKAAIESAFLTAPLSSPVQATVPYAKEIAPKPRIPLSTVLSVASINSTTKLGEMNNKLLLSRIVAKVTVQVESSSGFVLRGATILKAPRQGTFWRDHNWAITSNALNQTDYVSNTTTDGTLGISAAINNSTLSNPIYVYESLYRENTSLVVFGQYNGQNCFYRLAFKDASGEINIERNKQYHFLIKKIDRMGSSSLANAKNEPESNIEYELSTVDDDISHDIEDNGVYFLGVSNSQFEIYHHSSLLLNNVVAFSISTNATSTMLSGETNSIKINNSTGTILLTNKVNLAATANTTARTDVKLEVSPVFGVGEERTITVTLGTLQKSIKIRRHASIPKTASVFTFSPDVYIAEIVSRFPSGSSWVFLSDHLNPTLGNNSDMIVDRNIYAHFSTNGTGILRTALLYVSHTDSRQGRVKYLMGQQN